jgi:hypothetical protein
MLVQVGTALRRDLAATSPMCPVCVRRLSNPCLTSTPVLLFPLNLSQFVAALQGAEEKRARGKGTEYNSHETAAEASMPLGPLASAGGGIRPG